MLRYFAVLIYEHYELKTQFNEKFNLDNPIKRLTLEEIMQNICNDFGLSYETVVENSKLEYWHGSS